MSHGPDTVPDADWAAVPARGADVAPAAAVALAAEEAVALDREPAVRLPEKLAFALGDVFGGGGSALLNVLYFWFLSGVIGLPPALAGLVFAVGKVWDALSKPLVGQLSDNARTRWGRRRPFVGVGSVLLIAALATLYFPSGSWPQAGRVAFALLGILFYTTVATTITTPYASWSTEVATRERDRNLVNVFRLAASGLAGAIVTLSATTISHAVQSGSLSAGRASLLVVAVFGGVFTAVTLVATLAAKERVPLPAEPARFRMSVYALPPKVPAWRSLLGLYLCAGLTMDVLTTQLIALTLYVVHVNSTLFMAVVMVTSFASFPVITVLLRHVGKATIYGGLLPVAVVVAVVLACYQPSWPGWPGYVLAVFLAIGIAGSQQMTWVIFPDVVDAGELQLGERLAGTFAGLMTLIRSLGTAAVVQLIGLALQFSGYQAATAGNVVPQSSTAVLALRVSVGGLVALLSALGWLIARRYPLTREVVAQQHAELARRRAAPEGVR